MASLADQFRQCLPKCGEKEPQFVPQLVSAILSAARPARATDVHLVPGADGLDMSWRIDGVLQPVARFSTELAPRIIARLKVLSHLLTYRTDVPQEGRLQAEPGEPDDEIRLSTFPTLFGEKGVLRLFTGAGRFHRLEELGLPAEILGTLRRLLDETGGVVLITGPAGSGKTTTIYAGLRELADKSRGGRSLVSLEDPIEIVVPGVAQSQVQPAAGFDMPTGLRSLMRQDPEVIMVGEIRDKQTAETVFQAALTGHLVLTTFHAGSAAQAINRLSDMGIEPYLLRSSIQAIVCQRLARRLCDCAETTRDDAEKLGLVVESARVPRGCAACQETGYRGRFLLTELLIPDQGELGQGILSRNDSSQLEKVAIEAGMVSQFSRACQAVAEGITSPAEIRRILGFSG